MKFQVLIVDDEKNIREGLARVLELDGHDVITAADGAEGLEIVRQEEIDLVVADLRMPRLSGEDMLKEIVSSSPTLPVIILTGHGTIETAVDAMRAGAFDFITKPVNMDRFTLLVKRALSTRDLMLQHRALQAELEKKREIGEIIGRSTAMNAVFDKVRQVAPTRASVLVTGESGVGKELIADAIHNLSPRRDKPFVKVHCAALSENLLESELFGHEKGAFTGAVNRKRGRFELAHLGSLFLDEIGEISPAIQIKLLRVLQEKEFERVGGEQTVSVDVRIIAATNRDLRAEVEAGRFREDLFYRLNVIHVEVPPLRDRRDDIPLLAQAFIAEFADENGKPVEGIDPQARQLLHSYGWPGNIRELRNSLESAVVMAKGRFISPEDLPPAINAGSDTSFIRVPVGSTLDEAERSIILATLDANRNNKSRTAQVLGIGRKTLHRKLNDYGLGDGGSD